MMQDQLTGNGHRWGQRIAVDIPVQVAANDSPAIHGHLKNLSLSGALLEVDHELRQHAYIEVNIKLAGTRHNAVRIMARVTRKLKDAAGIEWCEFAPSAVKDLLRSPSIRLPPQAQG
jgi:PilZ domain